MTLRPIAEKKRRNIQLVPTNSRPPSFAWQGKILFGIIAVRDSEKAHIVGNYCLEPGLLKVQIFYHNYYVVFM